MPHADDKPMVVGDHPQCDPIKTRIIHVGSKYCSNFRLEQLLDIASALKHDDGLRGTHSWGDHRTNLALKSLPLSGADLTVLTEVTADIGIVGASGMLAAHKAKKFLSNYELVCYEKNASVGGTW
jgi:hypothetical protein